MNRLILAGIMCSLMAGGLQADDAQEATAVSKRILASEFPKTAARTMFFEDRINSKHSSIRVRVLTEVGCFYTLPDREYVSFLKRMYQDPEPVVRGMAIKKLYEMWVPQSPDSLPPLFTGYDNRQVISREPKAAARRLSELRPNGGAAIGYGAYAVGLLRAEEAISDLKALRADANIFVRYTAARALLDCGDKTEAAAIFDSISLEQLALYASDGANGNSRKLAQSDRSPWYAACACRGLIEVGGEDGRKGLKRLIDLMAFLERSEDLNDQAKIHNVRELLAALSGKYFTNAEEASAWMSQNQLGTRTEPIAPVDANNPKP